MIVKMMPETITTTKTTQIIMLTAEAIVEAMDRKNSAKITHSLPQ